MELILLAVVIGLHFILEVILGNSAQGFWAQLGQDDPERGESRRNRLGLHEFTTGVLPLLLLPAGLGLLEPARVAGLAVLCLSTGLFAAGRFARAQA
ncbi:hypothetical protein PCS_03409 [Desulfocurvibacter africanus PCS]|uniref:Uncharacterized protein n=1 Tax=Desulfocurvibacter africanus PCS TaxID=1262666 RepID=M5PPP8_DESAF|nr:hypothetical protein [Desulfocurvibacter africanus]EMG35925.1 hypothetical protein PCS_03409 [Desulfocurvibacter africanus PCS]